MTPAQRSPLKPGFLLLAASVVGLACLQYLMPPSFDNPPGVNHAGIDQFRSLVPMAHLARLTQLTTLSVSRFSWTFRLLLAGTWVGYAMILFGGYRHKDLSVKYTLAAAGSIALLMAFLFPPSLSSDVYAYAGWGRMWVLHGWNPYVHTLRELAETGDPAGLIAPVPASTTHGPVWIVIVCVVTGVLRGAGLLAQVVALKFLAAGAVLAAAISARAIAAFYDSRRAELALLAIGFNPIFLIEGPGSGHNDVLMAALMLSGIALCLKGRSRAGYLLLGLSIGIKFVSAAIVPWLIVQQVSRQPHGKRFGAAALAIGLVLAPILTGYAVFRVQTNAFDGIKAIYQRQTTGVQQSAAMVGGSHEGTAPAPSDRTGRTLSRIGLLLLVYGALSIAAWRSQAPGFYMSCWTVFSMALIVLGAPLAFAWYMVWPFSASLIRWDRFGLSLNLACAVMAWILLVQYTVPYAR